MTDDPVIKPTREGGSRHNSSSSSPDDQKTSFPLRGGAVCARAAAITAITTRSIGTHARTTKPSTPPPTPFFPSSIKIPQFLFSVYKIFENYNFGDI